MKATINILIISAALFLSTGAVWSQVTVGSGQKPVRGAILDIKSQAPDNSNVTSLHGGIVMPRLKLKNIAGLEPIIASGDPDLVSLKRSHTGLIVYNLTDDDVFSPGLYVWDGSRWEAVVTVAAQDEAVRVENGLSSTSGGDYIKLGGILEANTGIIQNGHQMEFKAGTGSFHINGTDFVIQNGNIGIGKLPVTGNKLDVAGNTQINGNLSVGGKTFLKETHIAGEPFIYTPDDERKRGKYLRAIDNEGQAQWQNIGGLSSPDMEPFPADKLVFDPLVVGTANYLNTGLGIELSPGKWLVSYAVRVVAPAITTANTGLHRPSIFRFTMLSENEASSPNGKKPYDDCRVYPDVYYNSCTGFVVVENDTPVDQIYFLGIKPQEIASWPGGNVHIVDKDTRDAYLIALFLGEK